MKFHCLKLTGPIQDNGLPVACHQIIQNAPYSSGASMDSDGPTGSLYSLLLLGSMFLKFMFTYLIFDVYFLLQTP